MTTPTDADELRGVLAPSTVRATIETNPSVRLVDVRTGAEFESQHIPGSLNVPLAALDAHLDALISVKAPLVLVCKSGSRASEAHRRLASAGIQQVCVLNGGIDAWQSTGGEIVEGAAERWAMDRQVRLVAGSLTLAGVGASIVAPRAKWLAGAIGAGLTFSAVSNTCGMANVLSRLPYNRPAGPTDTATVVEELRRSIPN